MSKRCTAHLRASAQSADAYPFMFVPPFIQPAMLAYMAGFHESIWAPWRMEYIRSLKEESQGGCFLCRYAADPAGDAANLVVWRTPQSMVVLNRFPYNNGHALISPLAHKACL